MPDKLDQTMQGEKGRRTHDEHEHSLDRIGRAGELEDDQSQNALGDQDRDSDRCFTGGE